MDVAKNKGNEIIIREIYSKGQSLIFLTLKLHIIIFLPLEGGLKFVVFACFVLKCVVFGLLAVVVFGCWDVVVSRKVPKNDKKSKSRNSFVKYSFKKCFKVLKLCQGRPRKVFWYLEHKSKK